MEKSSKKQKNRNRKIVKVIKINSNNQANIF